MKKLSVVMHTGPAQMFGNDVDHLHNISVYKEQFALKAFAPLSFQECCHSQWNFRVFAQSCAPIDPIAVVGTAESLHFHMSPNRSASMLV